MYTVTFDANGGSGSMAPVEAPKGSYTLPACAFTAPDGLRFKAWRTGGAEYKAGDCVTLSGDVTLTAVWEKIPSAPVFTSPEGPQEVRVTVGERDGPSRPRTRRSTSGT